MVPADADVVVIGGGINGCSLAYQLASIGVETIVIERGELNREASGTNAGNVHVQSFFPWDDPFGLNHARASISLHGLAGERWRSLESELGADLGVRLGGGLMVAETHREVGDLERKAALERAGGIDAEIISGREARGLAPYLSAEIVAAELCRSEGFANPLLAAPAFARRAIELGARVLLHTPVLGLERSGRGFEVRTSDGVVRAHRVVLAAGVGSAALAASVGFDLPIRSRMLTMNVTEPMAPAMTHVIQHIGRHLTLKQTPSGTFLIGGGWPGEVGPTGHPSPRLSSVAGNLANALRVMPSLRDVRLARSWGAPIPAMGARTAVVDEHPDVRGLFVLITDITGFTLGPLLGMLLAELIARGTRSRAIEQFSLEALGLGRGTPPDCVAAPAGGSS